MLQTQATAADLSITDEKHELFKSVKKLHSLVGGSSPIVHLNELLNFYITNRNRELKDRLPYMVYTTTKIIDHLAKSLEAYVAITALVKLKNEQPVPQPVIHNVADIPEKLSAGDPETLRRYFQIIFNLHESGEEFPVDLDQVWPLVYSEKSKAVRALLNDSHFIQDVDYHLLAQNGEKSIGRQKDVYKLSTPCLEFFIARKVRAIFEVYRTIFHATRKKVAPVQMVISNQDFANLQSEVAGIKNFFLEHNNQLPTRPDYITIMGYAVISQKTVSLKLAADLGRKAKAICVEKGYQVDQIHDPRFGLVNVYPTEVLKLVFESI